MGEEASKDINLGPKISENQFLSESDSNSPYSIVRKILLYLYLNRYNISNEDKEGDQFLSGPDRNSKMVGSILVNYDLSRVVTYFINHGAATTSILTSRLGLPSPSTFNYVRQLGQWGLIYPVKKARVGFTTGQREAGRIPDVWQTPDATTDQVLEATQLHRKLKFPKYNMAEKLAQSILNDYLLPKHRKETTFRDVKEMLEARGSIPKAEMVDVTEFVCRYLGEEGIKVWR